MTRGSNDMERYLEELDGLLPMMAPVPWRVERQAERP